MTWSSCFLLVDSAQLHTFNRFGGLKLMGRWTSHFQQGHIAYSSSCSLDGHPRDLVGEFVIQSMFMDGTLSQCSFSYGLQMVSMLHRSAFWKKLENGITTTLGPLLLIALMHQPKLNSLWPRLIVRILKVVSV